ncbi:hypothetical protein EC973_006240 [Apophysomyces ossiformis]|uniref:Uncharacterized protein n=1 Tax=Apophysomyces ossiformis TaxID=679940 RepID=A0A8H7BJQ4_9FUNG|nr:hypothetical protein EC973_006240 [Apophysomyces ossiformis]
MILQELTAEGISTAVKDIVRIQKKNKDAALKQIYDELKDISTRDFYKKKFQNDAARLLKKWKFIAASIIRENVNENLDEQSAERTFTLPSSIDGIERIGTLNVENLGNIGNIENIENIENIDCRAQFGQSVPFPSAASPIPLSFSLDRLNDEDPTTSKPAIPLPVSPNFTAAEPVNGNFTAADDELFDHEASFMSDDYHVNRKYQYVFSKCATWPSDCSQWMVDDFDVISDLRDVWSESIKGASSGDLSDLRILVLHFIFPFAADKTRSVTKYMDHHQHQAIVDSLKPLMNTELPALDKEIFLWANDLAAKEYTSPMEVKRACADVLSVAREKDDITFLAASTMFNWLPRLPFTPPSDPPTVEDTFVHDYLDAILNDIFGSDPIFVQEWANGYLETSRAGTLVFKPDWVAFVKPWFKRFDLGVCEVKPPGAKNAGVFSDYVKLGFEMKEMLNSLIKEGLDDARVCGFLVKGYNIDTYVMDLQHPPIYRMTLLSSTRLPDSVATFSLFPSLFRNVLHIKVLSSKENRSVYFRVLTSVIFNDS